MVSCCSIVENINISASLEVERNRLSSRSGGSDQSEITRFLEIVFLPKRMGKRSSGLAGLARFVQELKSDPDAPKSLKTNDSAQEPPTKKRKTTSNSGAAVVEWKDPWVKKYEATGLVPHYTHASEVPEHLQKCNNLISISISSI